MPAHACVAMPLPHLRDAIDKALLLATPVPEGRVKRISCHIQKNPLPKIPIFLERRGADRYSARTTIYFVLLFLGLAGFGLRCWGPAFVIV
jgi:hypothetical protein